MNSTPSKLNLSTQSKNLIIDKISIYNFFIERLQNLYYAEMMLVNMWQLMERGAINEPVYDTFEELRFVSLKHICRLENLFCMLNETPFQKTCRAIDSLTAESQEILMNGHKEYLIKDISLLWNAQKITHYQLASYCGLILLTKPLIKEVSKIIEKNYADVEESLSSLVELTAMFVKMQLYTEKQMN